jgi:hypothetical protein
MANKLDEMTAAEKADQLHAEMIYRESQVASLQLQISELSSLVLRTLQKKLANKNDV